MSKHLSLLHIEDSQADAYLFQHKLSRTQLNTYSITTVTSLNEAASVLSNNHFDAAFLDLNLPDGSGVATLERFRRLASELPVIVLTGTHDEEVVSDLVYYGAQDYIHKNEINDRFLSRIVRYAIDRKASEIKLEKLARFDSLTGLVNRMVLMERLEKSLASSREPEAITAVILLDLDNFKNINDTLGHTCGDELLKQVANRLSQCVRTSDTVARLGGDEFVVLLEYVVSTDAIQMICQKIITELSKNYYILKHKVFTSASVGIATTSHNKHNRLTAETIIKNADISMYRAKNNGGNQFVYFTKELQMAASIRSTLESALRKAIEHEEFTLNYQAQIDTQTNTIYGAEALLRWQHPEHGELSPNVFVPALESSGLIMPVSQWVIERSLSDWEKLHKNGILAQDAKLSLNISPKIIRHPEFFELIETTAQSPLVSSGIVNLEITENLFVESSLYSLKILQKVKEYGFCLSIDDFGTGYSSLSYLKHFPLDGIKLDRAFVKDILTSKIDMAIAKTAIDLAHAIGITIIAEGVDDDAKLELLQAHGCWLIQGFLFSKPMAMDQFSNYCEQYLTKIPNQK